MNQGDTPPKGSPASASYFCDCNREQPADQDDPEEMEDYCPTCKEFTIWYLVTDETEGSNE